MNNIPRLSQDEKAYLALNRRLDAGDLTLDEIRNIEDEALFRLTEKTEKTAFLVLEKVSLKRSALVQNEAQKLERLGDLSSKVKQFVLSRSSLTGEEVEERLESLQMEVELMDGNGALVDAVKRQLAHLEFLQQYPLAKELDSDSLESNFLTRMERVRDGLLEGNLELFSELSPLQQRIILEFCQGERR